MGFVVRRKGRIAWIEFPKLSSFNELVHFSTLRLGGVSAHPQASLNMGFVETDDYQKVIENRKQLASALNINFHQFVFSRQTHSCNIHFLNKTEAGRGVFTKSDAIKNNDGYIITESEICACVLTADCVPVFFFDPIQRIAAIAHSGWRGTAKRITLKILQELIYLGSNPKTIIIAIGPSIKKCCYEVGEDVQQEFFTSYGEIGNHFFTKNEKSYILDLNKAIIYDAQQVGVPIENIDVCDLCTHCNPHLFFSARNSKYGMTGRMMSGIMMRK
ncbi:MAG: peptidoglycan editing factor PgeF [Bacteroidales bacterium]|nr:peptidoglycan editing factor PgeF [Bacteroidales bacterium]